MDGRRLPDHGARRPVVSPKNNAPRPQQIKNGIRIDLILFRQTVEEVSPPGSAHHHKTLDVAPTDRYLIAAEHGPQIEAEWR
jgi:hypothetical protein